MQPPERRDAKRKHDRIVWRENLLAELDDRLSASGIRNRRRKQQRKSMMFAVASHATRIARRIVDVVFSYLLLLILSPILLSSLLLAELAGAGPRRHVRLGRWGVRFGMYQMHFPKGHFLHGNKFIENLPALINVVTGDMSLVGPRPIAPKEQFAEKRLAWKRYNLRPGVLSLWWIRKRANIAYDSEVSLDLEYIESKSLWGDLGIAARAIPATLYGGGGSGDAPPVIRFLGLRMDNLTMAEASTQIVAMARSGHATQVCFVNADCVNIACTRDSYKTVLSQATLVLADGIGIRLAGRILNQNVRENVNGTDMLPFLCEALDEAGLSIYLLGGKPGVPEDVARWMNEKYPNLRIAGTHHGYFTPDQEAAVLSTIEQSRPAVVLIAMGAPRQDEWAQLHLGDTGNAVMIGVGGLFDFYSGRIPRAPAWVRELGMEWFYRFYQEPRRMFRRYFLGNFEFLSRVVAERLRNRSNNPVEDQP
jgi:N-acetylglucosaminyldiphosphoundecaprenol N-acetyl-beta-D-mannosaminyltransferase